MNRVKHPVSRFELVSVAVISGLIVYAAGFLLDRDPAWMTLLAVAVAAGILAIYWIASSERRVLLAAIAVLALTIIAVINLRWLVEAELTKLATPIPLPTPPIKTIQISPCPSPGETLARRPDGAYVCQYYLPPDPKTGPTVASP